MDDVDRGILMEIQLNFPVIHRPFLHIGEKIDLEESQVMHRVDSLRQKGTIRGIGPVFNVANLGFVSTLVGAKVQKKSIEEIARCINRYPGVTHNYEREGSYNLWFTITAVDDLSLGKILVDIQGYNNIDRIVNLPCRRVFKIHVLFQTMNLDSINKVYDNRCNDKNSNLNMSYVTEYITLNDTERDIIKVLEDGLSITAKPYFEVASQAGISEELVLTTLRRWLKNGFIRRNGARLAHRKIGYTHNAMCVLLVDEERISETGGLLAKLDGLSHCYERLSSAPDWPFNLYAMVHGRKQEELAINIERVLEIARPSDYRILKSLREFKKTSLPLTKLLNNGNL